MGLQRRGRKEYGRAVWVGRCPCGGLRTLAEREVPLRAAPPQLLSRPFSPPSRNANGAHHSSSSPFGVVLFFHFAWFIWRLCSHGLYHAALRRSISSSTFARMGARRHAGRGGRASQRGVSASEGECNSAEEDNGGADFVWKRAGNSEVEEGVQGERIGLVSLGETGVGAAVEGEAEEWGRGKGGGDLVAHLGLDDAGPEVAPDVP
ncbi:hypothetical protein B0H14DRAFT_2656481 [Mycena olivaceomarginata]|nr:hypothetical protein B0H14DRAFT_2656481 [Mycena olivaceomarginata]